MLLFREHRYDSLKADLSVSLEETRGGADAAAFGARFGGNASDDDKPWATGTPKTFAHVVAAAAATASSSGGNSDEGGDGREEQFLWGCTSPQEERDQLVSYVSLGCFNPSARLQVRGKACRPALFYLGQTNLFSGFGGGVLHQLSRSTGKANRRFPPSLLI